MRKIDLQKLIKNKLNEAPIEYGDSPERMNPSIQSKIERGETPLSKSPGFPRGTDTQTFEEVIASKRFKDVVDKVKSITGISNVTAPNKFRELQILVFQSLQKILQIESQNSEYLENLAVDLVKKEMSIPEGSLQFDAKLQKPGGEETSKFQEKPQEFSQDEIEAKFESNPDELISSLEKFDLERAKRRLINAMVQGSAKKGHYMFSLVRDELNRLDSDLVNLYSLLMSGLDIFYWLIPDEMLQGNMSDFVSGSEEVIDETDPPTIKARGMIFPILVHELIKGVMDVLGTQGLPDSPEQAKMVMQSSDTLVDELWDIRLGPIIWEKFRESYPDKLYNEDKRWIQNYLFAKFSALDNEEFFLLTRLVLKGSQEGKNIINGMVDEIIDHFKNDDLDDEEYGDDDLSDLLGDLDISLT